MGRVVRRECRAVAERARWDLGGPLEQHLRLPAGGDNRGRSGFDGLAIQLDGRALTSVRNKLDAERRLAVVLDRKFVALRRAAFHLIEIERGLRDHRLRSSGCGGLAPVSLGRWPAGRFYGPWTSFPVTERDAGDA